MHALVAIDQLGDLDVAGDADQHIGVVTGHALRAHQPVDHVAQRLAGGVAEIIVEAHRDIGIGRLGAGIGGALALVQDELEGAGQRGLQRGDVDLAIALRGMTVAGLEQGALRMDRQEQGRAGDQRLVVILPPLIVGGALFQAGDGHAAQGNGEVDITALETSLTGTFQFILHKKGEGGAQIPYPRAETPDAYIAMGFDDDLSNATRKALRNMIDFLVTAKGMSRDDAYMLISVAGDVEVTELVDRNKGVHVKLAKALFKDR